MAASTIGQNLRRLRIEGGFTQAEAAERSGVAASTWCEWESGAKVPASRRLDDLADRWGVKVSVLVSEARAA